MSEPDAPRRRWRAELAEAQLSGLAAAKPTVFDADALNLLAADQGALPNDAIITPHPGEAARLLGSEVSAVQADRPAAALELANRYRCIAVLKGAGSLIAAPDGRLAACAISEPALASGGTGDVLTGLISALLAQGLAPFDAACTGVLAHACAGRHAGAEGARGTLAGDVVAQLRGVLNP